MEEILADLILVRRYLDEEDVGLAYDSVLEKMDAAIAALWQIHRGRTWVRGSLVDDS